MTITNYSMEDYKEEVAYINGTPSMAEEKAEADAKAEAEAKRLEEERQRLEEEEQWEREAEETLKAERAVIVRLREEFNANPTEEICAVLDEFSSSYSDLYKEVNGVRPHYFFEYEFRPEALAFREAVWEKAKADWKWWYEFRINATQKWMDAENERVRQEKQSA